MGDIVYKMPDSLRNIDYNNFSFRVKKKFDKLDKIKQNELNTKGYNWMGSDKARSFRSHIKTKDLRRWYPWEIKKN